MLESIFTANCTFPDFASTGEILATGAGFRLIVKAGLVRTAKIRLAGDGLFTFEEDGAPAYVTPVAGWADGNIEHPDPIAASTELPAIDLVAWHPARRNRWALLRGVRAETQTETGRNIKPSWGAAI